MSFITVKAEYITRYQVCGTLMCLLCLPRSCSVMFGQQGAPLVLMNELSLRSILRGARGAAPTSMAPPDCNNM